MMRIIVNSGNWLHLHNYSTWGRLCLINARVPSQQCWYAQRHRSNLIFRLVYFLSKPNTWFNKFWKWRIYLPIFEAISDERLRYFYWELEQGSRRYCNIYIITSHQISSSWLLSSIVGIIIVTIDCQNIFR